MKKPSIKIIYAVMLSFFFIGNCFSLQDVEIYKTFKKKDNLKISVTGATCFLKKSETGEIRIKIVHTYDSVLYSPEFIEESDVLSIKEGFKEKGLKGKAKWYFEIPDKTRITFNSESGNIEAEEMKCKFELNTESGEIKLSEISGEISVNTKSGDIKIDEPGDKLEINTASGNVNISDANERLKITTASGDVNVNKAGDGIKINTDGGDIKLKKIKGEVEIKSEKGDISISDVKGKLEISTTKGDIDISDFNPAKQTSLNSTSGKIKVELSNSLSEDLLLSTGSGDILLDFDGNSTDGYYEFFASKNPSKIEIPVDFQLVSSKGEDSKTEKFFKSGTGKPKITMKTESGDLKIEK
jgi:DUF4097 and DUF4098 domain-containing protein YvlB